MPGAPDHAQLARRRDHLGGDLGAAADDEPVDVADRLEQLGGLEAGRGSRPRGRARARGSRGLAGPANRSRGPWAHTPPRRGARSACEGRAGSGRQVRAPASEKHQARHSGRAFGACQRKRRSVEWAACPPPRCPHPCRIPCRSARGGRSTRACGRPGREASPTARCWRPRSPAARASSRARSRATTPLVMREGLRALGVPIRVRRRALARDRLRRAAARARPRRRGRARLGHHRALPHARPRAHAGGRRGRDRRHRAHARAPDRRPRGGAARARRRRRDARPGRLPARARARRRARGGAATIDARRSSQYVSAVLLAAPYAARDVALALASGELVSRPYVDLTLQVMRAFGARRGLDGGRRAARRARAATRGRRYAIEADASAAAYPFCAAAIAGGRVRVEGIGPASRQPDVGILERARAHGLPRASAERTRSRSPRSAGALARRRLRHRPDARRRARARGGRAVRGGPDRDPQRREPAHQGDRPAGGARDASSASSAGAPRPGPDWLAHRARAAAPAPRSTPTTTTAWRWRSRWPGCACRASRSAIRAASRRPGPATSPMLETLVASGSSKPPSGAPRPRMQPRRGERDRDRQAGVRVEADALTRRFGDTLALDGVSLAIAPGEAFGLLGANGAGKTTFIRCLTGVLLPSGGDVRVDGFSPLARSRARCARGSASWPRPRASTRSCACAASCASPAARAGCAARARDAGDRARPSSASRSATWRGAWSAISRRASSSASRWRRPSCTIRRS